MTDSEIIKNLTKKFELLINLKIMLNWNIVFIKVDNLIFPFMDVLGELEHLDWEPHYSQNTFSSEEIEFTDVDEFPDNEGEEFSKGKELLGQSAVHGGAVALIQLSRSDYGREITM